MQKSEWKGLEYFLKKICANSLESQAFRGGNPRLQAEYERICSSCTLTVEPGAKHAGWLLLLLCETALDQPKEVDAASMRVGVKNFNLLNDAIGCFASSQSSKTLF